MAVSLSGFLLSVTVPDKRNGINRHVIPLDIKLVCFNYNANPVKSQRRAVGLLAIFFFHTEIMDNEFQKPGCVAQSVGHLTRKSGVLGSIPGLATYFRFSFRFFKKGSCQLLAKVCARSTG